MDINASESSGKTTCVAVLPPKPADSLLVEKVASIIGKDLYATRLLLAGMVPRIAARCENLESAERVAQRLRALGLTTTTCPESQLRKSSVGFAARSLQFVEGGIEFSNDTGQTARVESARVSLIIVGQVETREVKEVTKTKTKLNLPATLLTGGIPIRRKVTETTSSTEVQTERFLRVYSKKTSHSIEIRQLNFDYSCVSQKRGSSSLTNFVDLTATIKNALPQAVFDDRLTGLFGLCLPNLSPWQNADAICHLIYLFTAGFPRESLRDGG